MKVQIISIHPHDAFFAGRMEYIGKIGEFELTSQIFDSDTFVSGWFGSICFYKIQIKEVK